MSGDARAGARLRRPQVAEARRLRAAELLDAGWRQVEVARAVGASAESVRRWQRAREAGGDGALVRRLAPGRPVKLDGQQAERVRAGLEQGALAHGFGSDLWTLARVQAVVVQLTGVELSLASVQRLLTKRLGWSLQRPQRRARERDEAAIARWVATEFPRIKRGL